MALLPQLKSIYLGVFNATMISRSLRRDLSRKRLSQFKIALFRALDRLTDKMDSRTLIEPDITKAIRTLVNKFGVSWGQAQKGINVILKCHQFLYHRERKRLKRILHCPLDSVVLHEIKVRRSLRRIKEKVEYETLQKKIADRAKKMGFDSRVAFDKYWDDRNLKDAGLL
jgi:hypothetical protein